MSPCTSQMSPSGLGLESSQTVTDTRSSSSNGKRVRSSTAAISMPQAIVWVFFHARFMLIPFCDGNERPPPRRRPRYPTLFGGLESNRLRHAKPQK